MDNKKDLSNMSNQEIGEYYNALLEFDDLEASKEVSDVISEIEDKASNDADLAKEIMSLSEED